jgi:hypothetical protein
MKFDSDGNMILGKRECPSCDGEKVAYEYTDCPLYWKPVRGKGYPGNRCPHCNAKNRDGHTHIDKKLTTCKRCNGSGEIDENICDTISDELWKNLKFVVYRSERGQSLNESLYGFGCCWSTTDYGRWKNKTDEELIEEVREHTYIQAINVVDRKTNKLCDHIGIFCNNSGYSVRAVHSAEKVVAEIITERPKEDMYLFGNGQTPPQEQIRRF